MRKIIALMMATGLAVSSVASAEPGTRKRLPPSLSEAEDVRPTNPTIDNRGDPTKGPNAYGDPADAQGKKRLGNSETPGRTNGTPNNYYSHE